MYLSLFYLDRSAPSVRQCLRNAHDMHRTVMSGFADVPPAAARCELGVLYRLQEVREGLRLYVLSEALPDWSGLKAGFHPAAGSPKDLSGLREAMSPGLALSFNLLCIPAKKVRCGTKNSRRRLLTTPEERAAWLQRKAEQNGFALRWFREDGQERAYVRRAGESAVHTGVRFCGELCVEDPQRFWQAFASGIGAGKAYGMGMMMLGRTGI